jgi:meiotic recombination protein SPO11
VSRKKKSKSEETVQATLGELLGEEPKKPKKKKPAKPKPKKTTKKTTKKGPKKATKKAEPTKKEPTKKTKKSPSKKMKVTKKVKPPVKKKASIKKAKKTKSLRNAKAKKEKPKKAESKPKKTKTAPPKEVISGPPLSSLPGVGKKLEERLLSAGYDSVLKLSKSRFKSLAKKVDGLSTAGAKELIKASKEQILQVEKKDMMEDEDSAETADTGEAPKSTLSLTNVPGVGAKLARRLESSGYDSVARLSRARAGSIAGRVSGLSYERADAIITAAKDLIQTIQLEGITGTAKTIPTSVTTEEPPEEQPKETTEQVTPKKKTEPKKTKASKKKKDAPKKKKAVAKKKEPAPPAKKLRKAKRTKSGLPVPKAVEELTEDLKKKWRAAARRARKPVEEETEQEETVEVVALTSDETKDQLIEVALEILNETMVTGRPAFEIPSRSGDNIVWDEIRDLLLLGMRTISRPYHSLGSVVDATRTARVMEIVFNLLKSNLHATKREIFYSDVNLFREQKMSDKIIEDVAAMLKTTRDSIHVVASARGSAMGRVVVRDGGDLIDLTKMGTGGWAITPFLDQVEIVESDAEYILLSEKDAAMMRLAEAKYWNREPCIVLTGKGSGDIATRAFLRTLVKELEIPAFALVDSDPYGHYIYSVFLRGSKRLSYESPFIATPELKLLGVLSRDLDEYKIPKSVRIPMEKVDEKRIRDMLKEPFVQNNKPWVKDLRLMLKLKEKAEIQAFASHSFEYLTDDYLPTKLQTGDWI